MKKAIKENTKEKCLPSSEWLRKVENRNKASHNHFNISKRAKETKEEYYKKK